MALNSEQKRRSVMLLGCRWRPTSLPLPEGTAFSLADRLQLLGVATAAVTIDHSSVVIVVAA